MNVRAWWVTVVTWIRWKLALPELLTALESLNRETEL